MESKISGFFKKLTNYGLTFDDVLLVPQKSQVLPIEADLTTRLTRNISLNIPFISAAMDTVTESRMAIALALHGGIGIIHKNLDIKSQTAQVLKVKQYLNGLIENPVTFFDDQSLEEVLSAIRENNYGFSGFPIIDRNGNLKGIITGHDLKFLSEKKNLKIRDVMSPRLITAPPKTDIRTAYEIFKREKIGKLPLCDKGGKLCGLYSFTDVKNIIENKTPMVLRDKFHRLRVGAAVSPYDWERVLALHETGCDCVAVDTAHGHSHRVVDFVRDLKKKYPRIEVIAGNIATGEAAADLIRAGADALKVGVGPGSICTTRIVTGVGVPQLTAIYEAACIARKSKVPVIADGGIKYSGDVPKALACGADSVMMGKALAGTDESPGEKIIYNGRKFVLYRGMGSLGAMQSGAGSRERYFQGDTPVQKLVPEGIEGMIPYVGSVTEILGQFTGGLRSTMGYCGSADLDQFRKKAELIQITQASLTESHPHGVVITKEAPNYRAPKVE
ncbi:MAG: IMP dehydrogenase [Candidatus Wallbacteria bacterium]|nr:IMP dehydrogenase [Candidatus Wallbacteria bacterium]